MRIQAGQMEWTGSAEEEPPLARFKWGGMVFLVGTVLFSASAGAAAQAADAAADAELRHEMAALVQTAQANHPRALEALAAWEAARQRRAGADGFFDPLLTVAAGRAEWLHALPGVPAPEGLREQSTLTRAAVERPLGPGLYARAGWTERFWDQRRDGTDERRESLLGLSVTVPLGRDRGLRQWRLATAGLEAEVRAGAAGQEDVGQYLRYETERRYLAWIEAANAVVLAAEAAARFEILMNEAIERERQGALPAYQVAPARMEWELRREEMLAATAAEATALAQLSELTGPFTSRADPSQLVGWASEATLPRLNAETAWQASAAGRVLEAQRAAAAAARRAAEDDLRPDLALEAGATWRAQGEDHAGGSADDRLGGAVLLMYRRPWSRRAEHAALAEARAHQTVLEARIENLRRILAASREANATAFDRARQRLDVVSRAVAAARATLSGERDRFRLGEGSGRAVLDAQKDLTDITLRQTRIAAALLRARTDYLFASGYAEADEPQTAPPALGATGDPSWSN